jgi:hypothetical protein
MPIPGPVRPLPTEYPPYYSGYIARVPAGDILQRLRSQLHDALALLTAMPDAKAAYRYAPGKWSVKEVVGHVIDTERIFAYRALAIARGETGPLPGFDENAYVAGAGFDGRSLRSLAEEWSHLRAANVTLFESVAPQAWDHRGTANNRAITARAIPYIIAGHERHHVAVLRERYL